MTSRPSSRGGAVAGWVGLGLFMVSCAGHRTSKPARIEPAPQTARTASMNELLDRVAELAGRAPAFTAEADLRFDRCEVVPVTEVWRIR